MDDSFNLDKHCSNEFDDSCFVVGAIHILGMDRFGEVVTWEFVSFDEPPIKTVDWGSTIDEGLGDDVFAKSVLEDR